MLKIPPKLREPLFLAAVFGLLLGGTFLWAGASLDSLPGEQKDDVFYDNIAVNMTLGRGFALDFDNEWFAEPYVESNEYGRYDWVLTTEVSGATTSRAPGFVFYLATIYKYFGRNFALVRICNSLILALGLTVLIFTVRRFHGFIAAGFATATMLFDFGVLGSAHQIMSEAIGTALLAVTFSLVIWAGNRPPDTKWNSLIWLLAGLFFGLTMLVRSTLVGWFMLAIASAAVWFMYRAFVTGQTRKEGTHRIPSRVVINGLVLFCIGAIVVSAPWWYRNCRVTGEFAPFGSAGSMGFVGGYSDDTLAGKGNWVLSQVTDLQDEWMLAFGQEKHTLAEREFLMGQESYRRTKEWIGGNVTSIPRLMAMKAMSHLALIGQPTWVAVVNGLLLFGVIVGCLFDWRRMSGWIAIFILLSVLTTMITWSHHGRYAIPVRPLMHIGCAIGFVKYWSFVLKYVDELSPDLR